MQKERDVEVEEVVDRSKVCVVAVVGGYRVGVEVVVGIVGVGEVVVEGKEIRMKHFREWREDFEGVEVVEEDIWLCVYHIDAPQTAHRTPVQWSSVASWLPNCSVV